MWRLKIAEGGEWLTTTNNHIGRQHWEFDPHAGTPQERDEVEKLRYQFKINRFKHKQSSDRLMRMQLTKEKPKREIAAAVRLNERDEISEETVTTTLRRAISFYSSIQAHDGHWPAESAGPLFFLPPLVMTLYVTGAIHTVLSPQHCQEIVRYIYNHQNEDGGWGLDIEKNHSTMFTSALCYICLRLLGEEESDGEDMAMARGRKWILDHGGLVGVPSWGKFWLSVIGLYDWSGCNPMPPEFWLLPRSFPFPGKLMCYSRLTYMGMSYLYGKRFVGPITALILSLRNELYNEPYHQIKWDRARNTVAKEDSFNARLLINDLTWGFTYNFVEPLLTRWPFSMIREKALKVVMQQIHYEDENSRYVCLGNAIKYVSLLACWVENPDGDEYKRHLARLPDYFWLAEDGLKIQSFGSQTWDACLSIQAIMSSNLCNEFGPTLFKAHDFIKASQIRENPSGDFEAMYRHISKGAWTFSMKDHGLQVSDCTADGLKCALLFSQMPPEVVGKKMENGRLYDAVNVILYLQSSNGGFPAWEPLRTYRCLEMLNSVEFFEDALIEKEYVECTSAAIQGLAMFRRLHPEHRRSEIDAAINKAVQYIEDSQEPDGSWYGCWGICYTYCTSFAIAGLVAYGRNYTNSHALRKACEFILSKQLPCGGWGESYLSIQNKEYTNIEGDRANLVQTAWALLSLIDAGQADVDPVPIHRGVRYLINAQFDDGDFPQEEITGAFFRYNLLNYGAYRNIFPIWALGKYRQCVLWL